MYSFHQTFIKYRTPREKMKGGPPGLRTASFLESNQTFKRAVSVVNIPLDAGPCAGRSALSPILRLTLEGRCFYYHLTDEETKSQGPNTAPQAPPRQSHIHPTDRATVDLTWAVNNSRSACSQGGLLPRKYIFPSLFEKDLEILKATDFTDTRRCELVTSPEFYF